MWRRSWGFIFHKAEPLVSFVYKSQQAGHQHRICETPEERKINMENWLHGTRDGVGEKEAPAGSREDG